jgi:hypothetical protein
MILYEGFELESPLEIVAGRNGICPKCGKALEFAPDAIKITPLSQPADFRQQ